MSILEKLWYGEVEPSEYDVSSCEELYTYFLSIRFLNTCFSMLLTSHKFLSSILLYFFLDNATISLAEY